MERFEFKVFYSIYKEALFDQEITCSVKKLFDPIFHLRGPFPNNLRKKDDNEHLEIDSKKASEWTGKRQVRKDIAMAAQNDVYVYEDIVYNFKNEIIPHDLIPEKVENTLKKLYDKAMHCDIDNQISDKIKKIFESNKIPELYAQLFVWSLYVDGLHRKSKEMPEPSTEALDEFEKAIRKKYHKPRANVPDVVSDDERELNYVSQLLGAYEEASGDTFEDPDDLKGSDYEDHFKHQRKYYYQAELIHQEIRDVVRKDEDEGFETLKEEIEEGVYLTAHKKYDLGFDKANAVLERAGSLPISQRSNDNMLGWVGPSEKMGVCHILVNEEKLKWLEDEQDE